MEAWPTKEDTARSITNTINRHSRLVYANLEGSSIQLELREESLQASALVVFADDPGGQDIVAEKGGIRLDHREIQVIDDYKSVVELVLEDGVISPSEDQLLWAMRSNLASTITITCPSSCRCLAIRLRRMHELLRHGPTLPRACSMVLPHL